jgi:imidazolonepropionase-like amidohydrolase/Tol biopolymer transport system component
MRYLLLWLALMPVYAAAQEEIAKKNWDVNNPPGPYKEVSFTVEEGTWMNLDLSPDGKTLVFDLLGDIYSMPAEGGQAKILRSGYAYEVQPRFSPDGKKISFTSDAGGGDNIWLMNADGSEAKQITAEDFRLLNNAAFTPDGQYLVARKHFTATRSAGAGEIWLYHINGGAGLQLTKKKNDQQDAGEPIVSADGRYVYFSEDMYPGGGFQYNKNPNAQIYVIRRLDRETGEIENIIKGPGGAVRPVLSHDGKTLAFVRRVRDKSVLYLHNMETGEQWPVYDQLSKDQQEAWALFGVYTNFAFTPDDKYILIWAEGKIRKISLKDGSGQVIPFKAESKHRIADALRFKQDVSPDSFMVNTIRHAITSPDGKVLVFNAAGFLWRKLMPMGKPERLTKGNDFEYEPSFSPDGKQIVYVSWNDTATGSIRTVNNASGATARILTRTKGIYRTPRFSPDGKTLVFVMEDGNDHQGFTFTENPGVYLMPSSGGTANRILKSGEYPHFTADGKRIFYSQNSPVFSGMEKALKSCNLNGFDQRVHFTSKYAGQITPSPDNKWVAFSELFKVYVAPFIPTGQPVDLSNGTKSYPVSQVARDAGTSLHWSSDSKSLFWVTGQEYFKADLNKRFRFLEGAPDTIPPIDTTGLAIGLKLPTDKPRGLTALTNARIITMKGDEVIERGTILIRDNRIEAIGNAQNTLIPGDANVIDCSGKTISPGFVDVHAHLGTFRNGLSPQKQWSYYANLAYGVTTTHDPSSNSEMVFSQSEMVKAGHMTGPRIYSTGIILYGADGDFKAVINSLDDARSALRRTKAYGAFSVKSYNQPRRNQRQQVIAAGRALNMMVVPEGGSHFLHNMSMILDGHTGIEHNVPVHTIYDDVVKLWSSSATGYTPTLVVAYGSIQGENYWYQKSNVWEKERLLRFTPRAVIDGRSRHRTMSPDDEYENGFIKISKACKQLSDAGVKVNLGAHGQLQGLGAHWELWMLAMGGMSNLEALRAATFNGAHYIGLDHDIGSLERGKLADLIIFDKNPLEDIRNTEYIRYTMVNGRLFDAESMDEAGLYPRKRSPFYWEYSRSSLNFPWHEETHGFHSHSCSCNR